MVAESFAADEEDLKMNSLFNREAGKVLKSKGAAVSLAGTGKHMGSGVLNVSF